MDEHTFAPFYERAVSRLSEPFVGKLLVSLVLASLFLVPHHFATGGDAFTDFSWFLSVLIFVAMMCLYYATHTLRVTFPELDARLGDGDPEVYLKPLERVLSDRNFLIAGGFFGVANCYVGHVFGIPYAGLKGIPHPDLAVVTIQAGFFIAGFVCGMAAYGIVGVSIAINAFSRRAKPRLDFTSPDRCGGTVFLGEALVIFSGVTLIVGVMISIFIVYFGWKGGDGLLRMLIQRFWIAFPYIMSALALVGPAVGINEALRKYKLEEKDSLRDRMAEVRNQLDDPGLDPTKKESLRKDYEFLKAQRADLHKMRTWPYGLGANLKYLTVFVANAFGTFKAAMELLKPAK
jgi:hypothetical protein